MALKELDEPAAPVAEPKVIVHEVITREDGTIGIGNAHEHPMSEAVAMIEDRKGKAEGHPIGVVPEGWTK